MDSVVCSWLLGSITNDLASSVMARSSMARATRLPIESQFLDNRGTRALFLYAEFQNFCQGDLSVIE